MSRDRSESRAARQLRVWEQGSPLPRWERALLLAGEVGSEYADQAALRGAPIGELHRLVLTWRAEELGPELTVTVSCPSCGTVNEFAIAVANLLDTKPMVASGTLVHGERTIAWRIPTVDDVLAVAGESDRLASLRARCVDAGSDGLPESPWPETLWEALDRSLAAADPLAEIVVEVACSSCAESFPTSLDPVEFVWAEVDAAAVRTLHEVDLLARAYGWAEADILALGDIRRTAYLRLVVDGAP